MTGQPSKPYRKGYVSLHSSQAEGEVLIPPNLSMTAFSLVSLILIATLATFIIFGEYTRKARLEGIVMPSGGLIKIMTRSDGAVTHLQVIEGESVKSGQVLYRISGEHYNQQGKGALAATILSLTLQYQMLERQRELEGITNVIQQTELRRRQEQLNEELSSASSGLTFAQQQVTLLRTMMVQHQKLVTKHYISQLEFLQRRIELSIADEKVENHRQLQLRLKRELSSTHAELEKSHQQNKSRHAELSRQLQLIDQQKTVLAAQAEMTLTAPVDGYVAVVLANVGQTVKPNDPMLMLVPHKAELKVELYAPSKSIGFIKPQQRVGLRFASFPYEKFGVQYGTTQDITHTSLSSHEVMSQNQMVWKENEGHYRIIVNLDKPTITAYGREEPLRVGMTVVADVELDKRRLYEWLLEPLWSVKGKM
ncbi:HlyD family efflux transporter periplasmic adaptor subunit [Yersinia rochesterensis]|uniref:HlyD family secretion protein n=1 Tax=Yersinia TaxID=629 RepID=UPI00223F8DE2|nr:MULTISPECIES: HlyD family efflux transporter periplasmic adaptor subunit [Yersinia]MDA5543821.1 HlyD family efflux transporter periplasmic adaptor subunit [Yersinia rochesterensis]UZM74473.1 HlyD family efflux transporter periplasmic adaptor subunit [Yersinia sp. SCPM-O-B-9106 (C-191)]